VGAGVRAWAARSLPSFVLCVGALASAPGHAAQYTVDGITLGQRVTAATPNYRSYRCGPSDDFADAVRCERTQELSGKAGRLTVVHSLIRGRDSTAIYIMANAAPVALSTTVIATEIQTLTRVIGESPTKVQYLQQTNPAAVIAIWGGIRLEEVGGDDIDTLARGNSPRLGVLVDYVGDLQYSAKHGLPVYRIVGGAGYVYAASVNADGRGTRHYVAVDATRLAVARFDLLLQATLQKDRSLAANDYSLWPDVALITRNLALDTSVQTAEDASDRVFDAMHSDKLRSHVWAMLPLGSIQRLAAHEYSRLDQYGPQTEHPQVRHDIENFLATHPADHFLEFAYYTVGDFQNALATNPNSVISDVLQYGSGYQVMQSLMQDTLGILQAHVSRTTSPYLRDDLKTLAEESPDTKYHVSAILTIVNHYPDLRGGKQFAELLPNFAVRAALARGRFEAVLRQPSSPLADDAAYMLGWLSVQEGQPDRALSYFSQAMTVGNADYLVPALRGVVGVMQQRTAREQINIVESSEVFARQPALWYAAARSAYREFDYAMAIDAAQRGLAAINVSVAQLPVTTDAGRIEAALERINPKFAYDANVKELPYLIEASREILQYQQYLQHAASEPPDAVSERARAIIFKYSQLRDPPEEPAHPRPEAHKDLRQAVHMIDMTLKVTAQDGRYAQLREWLYYRKVRSLALFAPELLPGAIAAMASEFPTSKLLNDALAEEVFAEGITMKDPDAAEAAFHQLLDRYPDGNAVDNAYSWMEIILRCSGRIAEAQKINEEIIRRFPYTRHAGYARDRMTHPDRFVDPNNCGWH
jgi:tetratricopeptide (TPR) repeat protein